MHTCEASLHVELISFMHVQQGFERLGEQCLLGVLTQELYFECSENPPVEKSCTHIYIARNAISQN